MTKSMNLAKSVKLYYDLKKEIEAQLKIECDECDAFASAEVENLRYALDKLAEVNEVFELYE
jgi:hypothetical protein